MLNRPATKIDLCLEEELNEYEQMKEYRIKHKETFEAQFSKLINYPLDDDPSKYLPSSTSINNSSAFAALQQTPNSNDSSSNIKNYYNQPKEFNLSNVLFSGGSSSKKPPINNLNTNIDINMNNPYVKQFHTPDNK
jgi:hypothetical protein